MKKISLTFLIVLVVFSFNDLLAQSDEMFNNRREHRRVWRKHRRTKDAYNPYLKKKGKDKPSAIVNKGNKKADRRQKRAYKKQLKKSKKSLNN